MTIRRPTSVETMRLLGMVLLGSAASGCISINAPEKPIVITLNVNITQEVVYRLDREAKDLIQQNPGIF